MVNGITPEEAERYIQSMAKEFSEDGLNEHSVLLPFATGKPGPFSTPASRMQRRLEQSLGSKVNRSFAKLVLDYQAMLDPSSGQKMDVEKMSGETVLGKASRRHNLKLSLMVTRDDVFLWWTEAGS